MSKILSSIGTVRLRLLIELSSRDNSMVQNDRLSTNDRILRVGYSNQMTVFVNPPRNHPLALVVVKRGNVPNCVVSSLFSH